MFINHEFCKGTGFRFFNILKTNLFEVLSLKNNRPYLNRTILGMDVWCSKFVIFDIPDSPLWGRMGIFTPMKIRLLSVVLTGIILASCNPFVSDPTADQLSQMFGIPVSDVSCAAASGKPGRVCSFKSGTNSFTRRLVKLDNGSWDAVAN